jgi:hypothetical protein
MLPNSRASQRLPLRIAARQRGIFLLAVLRNEALGGGA